MTKFKTISLKKIKRINAKLDLSFWAIKPYKEMINYVIDGTSYNPVSYRFLFIALIVVYKEDVVTPVQKEVGKTLSKKYD